MNKHVLVLAVLLTGVFTGCYYDNEEELYPNSSNNPGNCDLSDTKYSTQISSIISTNCATAGCHVAGAQSPDLSTYAGLKANVDRVKVRAIDQKTMPASGPLSDCDINKLTQWISNGALNN